MKSSKVLHPITVAAITATMLLVTTACAPTKTNDLMAPPPTYTPDKAVGDGLTVQFNPRVDILFVIDNSKSMLDEQEKLKAASAMFVEKLGANSVIDYRIGVITVFDKTHCGDSCYPAGKLRGEFVSRSKDAPEKIKQVLDVGVQPIESGGPEFEELFTPILQALGPMNAINGGFIRPDSRVVVVMVTDESDSSLDLSIDDFMSGLKSTVGLGRLDLYSIVTKSAADRNNSLRDRTPIRIQNAIAAAEASQEIAKTKMFNIKDSNFGEHLGTIVTDIRKRVLSQRLLLPSAPEKGTIKLYYLADDETPNATNEVKQGWSYNALPSAPTITINDNIKVEYAANKRFRAEYIKIEQHSVKAGKVKTATVKF